jgi:hypothetical protein
MKPVQLHNQPKSLMQFRAHHQHTGQQLGKLLKKQRKASTEDQKERKTFPSKDQEV